MKRIPLTKGQFAIVDDEDFERLSKFKWRPYLDPCTGKFKVKRGIYVGKYGPRGHRKSKFVFTTMANEILGRKPGFVIDHINLDSLDNRKSNLRYATSHQNLCNKRLYSNNTLGFKGVTRNGNGFIARVVVDGRRRSLGTFKTLIEAARAYNRGAMQHYAEFARLNQIESRG